MIQPRLPNTSRDRGVATSPETVRGSCCSRLAGHQAPADMADLASPRWRQRPAVQGLPELSDEPALISANRLGRPARLGLEVELAC
jgi:hypothetical protein